MDENTKPALSRQKFWEIMNRCHDNDTNTYLGNLEAEAANMSKEEVAGFRSWLGAYLNAASECVWLDMACKVINGYVSDDTSLYFTLWVIAQGEERLLAALLDPDTLADLPYIQFGETEFEMLMYVGFDPEGEGLDEQPAYQEEAGEASASGYTPPPATPYELEIAADVAYKNGDLYGGFDTFEDAMAAIPEHLHRLIARAEREGFDWKNYI